jgi:hypothetical protein
VEEIRGLDLERASAAVLAQAAVALHHGYSAVESVLERTVRALEGSLPTGADWHVALLESMALEIQEVRPPILSAESLRLARQLLAFRHFFRHAYAIKLEAAKLAPLREDMIALSATLDRDLDRLDSYLSALASTID